MRNHRSLPFVVLVLALVGSVTYGDGPIISEFMASNRSNFADADGDFPDWIEIHNAFDTAVDLSGWSLTDNLQEPTQWVFPAVNIAPRGFLVVFASGKDERDPSAELHTNFSLMSDGEHLSLHDPAGQVVSAFVPSFPEQLPDASYGAAMQTRESLAFDEAQAATFFVPADDALATTWTQLDFDDASWQVGTAALGFDTKETPDFADLVGTNVAEAMQGTNSSIYLRIPFAVDATKLLQSFRLQLRYADGFVAYLNGTEIARRNTRSADAPVPGSKARAAARRLPDDVRSEEEIRLGAVGALLREGENVLAVHALSSRVSDTEFLFAVRLEVVQVESTLTETPGYFEAPTPAWPNGEALGGVAETPTFSLPGGTFTEAVTVEISSPEPMAEIHLTRDGSVPTAMSELYAAPILVEGFEILHARAFHAGRLPSRTGVESYVVIGPDFDDFTSNLPIIMIHAKGAVTQAAFTPGHVRVFDVAGEDGRSALTGPVHVESEGGFKQRGSSTAGQPKLSLTVELRDERGDDEDAEIFGFPAESDFVLYAAYDIDRTLMRNALAYELSNRIGRYAARTRFCEVFLNRGGGPLAERDYMGVYSFMEKLKRGGDRIDVESLGLRDNSEPEVAGGYILKRDRLDPGDIGLPAGGERLALVYPKESAITAEQATWISGYFDDFAAALGSPDANDPELGYRQYVNVGTWIDHHLFVVFTRNKDGLGLSTYFQKPRGGRLEAGPIWDYDRSMSSSVQVQSPFGFAGKFTFSWWGGLFEDPWFWERYKLRWKEIRAGPLSTENMHALIDSMSAELAEAQVRNFERWGLVGGDVTWESLVAAMREWLAIRVAWIDEQFVDAPEFSVEAGSVSAGQTLELTVPRGAIYFTRDGSDPRGEDGEPSTGSTRYGDPLSLNATVTIRARTRIETVGEFDEGLWSSLVEAAYEVEGAAPGMQRPGDVSQDGKINLLDAIGILRYLTGEKTAPCTGAGVGALLDWTGDGAVDLTDVLQNLNYLFQNGAPHPNGIECVAMSECPEVCGG